MATVKVILLESLKGYGSAGNVVEVPGGFARNYLLRFRKARYATQENIEALEIERAALEKKDQELQKEAEQLAQRLAEYTLHISREAGENGALYGSVTGMEIARLLKEEGFSVGRQAVRLADPIKMLGSYKVALDLHPQVSTEISVELARN